ncbi:HD domain-containing protein [Roseospirillum parvum]|uniref:HD/PDEase domain-containing protein n=1 Tax=Roseospirillum parvum TaxID=83401 RepID=A0A1G7ZCK5_9PROT|nr:HD domain-containing protein [Roseospirillum parvum]SDH06317.1 hypothetical protein SAMN05421742_10467 [Roseospirillum parvum]
MPQVAKPQRIRDPLHDLITFGSDQFQQTLWSVIQTEPFQRLRRVRQLGFSEFTFPGATHTRFAHSLGAFHTARRLMEIIKAHLESTHRQVKNHQADVAVAAALVHDVGHGMMSHAFEKIGKRFDLALADHEEVGRRVIQETEIAKAFEEMGSGFANDVAELIGRKGPGNLYDAVVSSQFDADRLDYMRRDSLMTGVRNSLIDFEWLMANLEVNEVKAVEDEVPVGEIETFVLGPKATQAAENYVLSLFHLYTSVYFHKATRGAEAVFTELMARLMTLIQADHTTKTGLHEAHPFVRFAQEPTCLDRALKLDDTVFWGALPMLRSATDEEVARLAEMLLHRRLPCCRDVRLELERKKPPHMAMTKQERDDQRRWLTARQAHISERIEEWNAEDGAKVPRLMVDKDKRDCYTLFKQSKGPLNQIHMRSPDGSVVDMAHYSPIVAAAETFEFFRVYVDRDDQEARDALEAIIKEAVEDRFGEKES